jgi:hypothetical protein
MLILVIISLLVFLVYNIAVFYQFGVPSSLSDTYYLYEAKKKHLGLVFPEMMSTMAFTLLPAWLELGEVISSWSSYLNPLAFFTCAAILFVGGAPAFRSNKLEGTVHEVSAKVAAACAISWCLSVCWKIMYVPLGVAGLIAAIGAMTKTWKSASVYWLEMMAFGATFVTVIVELILQLI